MSLLPSESFWQTPFAQQRVPYHKIRPPHTSYIWFPFACCWPAAANTAASGAGLARNLAWVSLPVLSLSRRRAEATEAAKAAKAANAPTFARLGLAKAVAPGRTGCGGYEGRGWLCGTLLWSPFSLHTPPPKQTGARNDADPLSKGGHQSSCSTSGHRCSRAASPT